MTRPIGYRFTLKDGEPGKLDRVFNVRASNVIAAGRAAGKLVGKLGYHGVYIPQHVKYGWGQWFVVCNLGANATYEIEGIA